MLWGFGVYGFPMLKLYSYQMGIFFCWFLSQFSFGSLHKSTFVYILLFYSSMLLVWCDLLCLYIVFVPVWLLRKLRKIKEVKLWHWWFFNLVCTKTKALLNLKFFMGWVGGGSSFHGFQKMEIPEDS